MALVEVESKRHTSSNGGGSAQRMHEVLHLPDTLPAKHHWRDKLRAWLHRAERQWEPVTVNKSIDSVTMPKWIAIGILGAVLTFGIQSWWRGSDQRDMIIELKTELRLSREYDAERARQLKEQAELNQVRIEAVTGELRTIKGMLSTQQTTALDNAKRGSN